MTEGWEPFVRLLAAAAFAGAIGFDRELRAKPAGLRTNIVVGVAAAAFGYVSVVGFDLTGQSYDPSRVASQIVSGIGFLGGGAIFAAGGKPHGLTTAAALWGSAAAGLAAGLGEYWTGLALVVVTLIALWPLDLFSERFLSRRRREDTVIQVVVGDLGAATAVREALRAAGVRLADLDLRPLGDRLAMDLSIHGTRPTIADTLERLATTPGVVFVSEHEIPRIDA